MRIAALCGFGMGTSLMMKMNVMEILDDFGLKATVDAWDLGSYKGGEKADIIVAPSDMKGRLKDSEATVILLDNIVSKGELEGKLKAVLSEKGVI